MVYCLNPRLDDVFKASAYLWETASDPKIAKSGEPTEAAFCKAVSNGRSYWDFIGQPENIFKQRRFDMGMQGTQSFVAAASIIAGNYYT
jgi:hypothetical protein